SIANSAANALKQITSGDQPFDCLLLDIQMPEMTGIELLREIRSIADYAETPVIMLTAMTDRKYVDDAFMEGATDYVAKPFDYFELRSRMNAAHKLMQERIKARKSQESAKLLRDELEYNQQFNFQDPLTIDGLERHLRYVEFDNYLAQLSRGRLFDSAATAIKIQDAECYFDLTNCGDFRRAVSDVGFCISKTTKDSGAIFSYRGSGLFLVITHGRKNTATLPTEEWLNQLYGSLVGQRRAPGWVRILMGDPFSMRTITKSNLATVLSKTIEDVENRELLLHADLSQPTFFMGEKESARPVKVHKNLYERALWELYGEKAV
ncbi:MAG: response regulator, partial [Pseudomonadota bacterium]